MQAVYQKIFSLLYLDELLELVKQNFVELFKGLLPPNTPPSAFITPIQFEDRFVEIMDEVETTSKKRPIKQKKWEETEKAKDIIKVDKKKDKKKKDDPNGDGGDENKGGKSQEPAGSSESEVEKNRQKFIGMITEHAENDSYVSISKANGHGQKEGSQAGDTEGRG